MGGMSSLLVSRSRVLTSRAVSVTLVIAPFLGGVLTDRASWSASFDFQLFHRQATLHRAFVDDSAGWCFWINLPLGGFTLLTTFFLVQLPKRSLETESISWKQFAMKIDLLGNIALLPGLVSLLLALQFGGAVYSWNSWRCILLLCIFGIFSVAWAVIQVRGGDNSTLPRRLLKIRSILAATWFAFCLFGMLFIQSYYIPIWFQVAGGDSAYTAGISTLLSLTLTTAARFLTLMVAELLATTAAMTVCFPIAGLAVGAYFLWMK